jgi:hypothetical protein
MIGKFELRIPVSTRRVLVNIRAPGRVLQSYEVAADDKPVVFDLAAQGGTVRVLYPTDSWPVILRRDGVLIPSIDLEQWAYEQGRPNSEAGSLVVPNLAPGMYEACLLASSKCVQRVVTASSVVEIDLR